MGVHHNPISNPTSLLLRPQPFRNEGPKGYMLRLAEANWMHVRELELIGLMYEPRTLICESLLPAKEIDPELHSNVEYYSELLFNKKRVWNHQYARFCPICLAEDAYWRVEWELLFNDVCTQHQIWLVDSCSSCNKPISWTRDSLIRCECGADLRLELSSSCPDSIVVLSKILKHKINSNYQGTFSAPFKSTDIEEAQRLIRYLGTYMSLAAGKNPLKINQAGLMANSWPVTTLAAEICSNWPEAFNQSLDKIQREGVTDKPTLSTVFGHAYHYLYKGFKGSAYNELRGAFETWLSASWKGGLAKRNKRLATVMLEKASWIPANLACEMLGISHQRLAFLIREGMIEGETYLSEKGRRFVMVRRDNLEAIKHNLSGEIDMKTAGMLLGLNKKRIRQMLRLIFPEASKKGTSASATWTVPRFEINNLLSLTEDVPKVFIPDEGCVSLNHIFRYWAWTAQDLASLIRAVSTAELKPENILNGATGISGWIFNENILKAWKVKSQQGFGIWLTISQTAKLIGIKEQVAYQMVHMGLLKAETLHRQPKGGSRIRRTEVEQFKQGYIFATEVAQRLGVSPRKATSILGKQSISPISGPSVDEGRQVLYLRSEQIENIFKEIINAAQMTHLT